MIHRLALIVGSVTAALVLAFGFVATGFGPRAATADAEQPTLAAGSATPEASATRKPITRVKTTTVYVRPAPKRKVIHVTKRAPASSGQSAKKHTKVVHVTKPVAERDDDGEHEPEDD